MSKKIPIDEIKIRIYNVHGDVVTIDESTYAGSGTTAKFIDKDYGEWWTRPINVIYGSSHIKRKFDKIKETCLKRYGTQSPNKSEIIIKKRETTCIARYGVEYPSQSQEIKNKIKKTCLNRFGTTSPFENDEIKKKIKETNILLYGVENPFQAQEIKEKIRKTNLARHGYECILQDKEKMEKALFNKYGVKNISQNRESSLKAACSMNNSGIIKYWKTGEEHVWTAGYEKAFLEWANKNQIEFEWQIRFETPFFTPNGNKSFYFVDAHLIKEDKWVEIKGYPRSDAQCKWNWFHEKYSNSELWNNKRLKELGIL